jgi:hypothetical protein
MSAARHWSAAVEMSSVLDNFQGSGRHYSSRLHELWLVLARAQRHNLVHSCNIPASWR